MKNKLIYLLFLVSIIACAGDGTKESEEGVKNGSEEKCETTSLLPDLSAKICLPPNSRVNPSVSNSPIEIKVVLPSGKSLFIMELHRGKGEEGALERHRNKMESALEETAIHQTTPNYFIEKTNDSKYVIYFFKSSYGWPYMLKSSELNSEEDIEYMLKYLNTFEFTSN